MRYILTSLLVLGLFGFSNAGTPPIKEKKTDDTTKESKEEMKNPLVLMQTNFGDITIEIYEKEVPIHAGNFLKLVDESF